jgi:hypothetical protein
MVVSAGMVTAKSKKINRRVQEKAAANVVRA